MSTATLSPPMGHCAWCAVPKAKKGLVIGILASLLLHAAALGAVAQLGNPEPEFKKEPRVIYLGEITIRASKKKNPTPEPKEI